MPIFSGFAVCHAEFVFSDIPQPLHRVCGKHLRAGERDVWSPH